MNAAAQGDAALASSDIPNAIKHFTQALTELPRAPSYYIKRSTAYSRLKPADGGPNASAALRDAEIALQLARERGKREMILLAQMRRGIALYHLERYGDAAFVFERIQEKIGSGQSSSTATTGTSSSDNSGEDRSTQVQNVMSRSTTTATKKNGYEQELPIWTLKVKGKLNKLEAGDERATVTVTEFPANIRIPTEKDLKLQLEALKSGKSEAELVREQNQRTGAAGKSAEHAAASTPAATPSSSSQSRQTAPVQTTVRHEWYQNNDSVVVTLYAKGVPKDSVDVDLKDDSVSVQFPLAGGAEFAFTLDPLYAHIDASASKVSVMSTKLEISLRKRVPGQKWGALEAPDAGVAASDRNAGQASSVASSSAVAQPPSAAVPTSTSGPAYPTSSRHGAKDWDKLASKLTEKKKKKSKDQGKSTTEDSSDAANDDESDSAESVDSEFGGDPVDAFFKKLYKNADPDTRRAMMKSYIESQGTALSTNWSEVGQGKVEVRPPSDD